MTGAPQAKPGARPPSPPKAGARAPSPPKAGEPWEIVHADFLAAAGPGSELPDHGLEIAFAGRSNVGKSSLINALTGRKNLVRTGATPGVTRTLTQFSARTRDGRTFALVDLPGYGFAARSKGERRQWADLIEGYLREREQLVMVVLLVDPRRGLEEDDRALLEFVGAPHEPSGRPAPEIALVATKIDKINRSAQHAALSALGAQLSELQASGEHGFLAGPEGKGKPRAIAWSSVTGQGRSDLCRRIALALERAGARR